MNSNKAQSTYGGQDREEAASATSAQGNKRSAPIVVRTLRSSAPKKQRDGAVVVEEAADNPYQSNKKKKSSDNVVDDDANNNGQCEEDDTDGEVKTSLRAKILAKKSNPHDIVDTKDFNFESIVAKCQSHAVDYNEVDVQKKPYPRYFAWYSSEGDHIMSIPPGHSKGMAAFRKLDSLSKTSINSIGGLHSRMIYANMNGEDLDGFVVKLRNEFLWADEIGFPNDEALLLGQELARRHKDRMRSHFSGLTNVTVGMSKSLRVALACGCKPYSGLLKTLNEGEVEYINRIITKVHQCEQDPERSNLSGQNIFRTWNETNASGDKNAVAIAMVKSRVLNSLRVRLEVEWSSKTMKNIAWPYNLTRTIGGVNKVKKLHFVRDDPDRVGPDDPKPFCAITTTERKKLGREFSLVNFILGKCVTFKDVEEQGLCLAAMCECLIIKVCIL
eukprot:scaffold10364_cov155-Skeletonema_dohrnii-CCMP3373.AAC.3